MRALVVLGLMSIVLGVLVQQFTCYAVTSVDCMAGAQGQAQLFLAIGVVLIGAAAVQKGRPRR